DEGLALGGAPCDAAEDAAILAEGHLQVAVLETARAVDDLDVARAEDGAWIAGAKRREHRQLGSHLLVDRAKRQRAVDPQARTEVVGAKAAVGKLVHTRPKLTNLRRLDRQPGRLLMPAELRHHLAAR